LREAADGLLGLEGKTHARSQAAKHQHYEHGHAEPQPETHRRGKSAVTPLFP
jgi:hypothetical protein